MLAPVTCEPGERIVAYLDNLGRIEGIVVRSFEGGFAVRILASLYKRERIANLLTWLVNQKAWGLAKNGKHERVVPRINASKLILPNGAVHNCRVIDVSLSGASVACTVKPPVGTDGRSRPHARPRRAPSRARAWPFNSSSFRTPTASPALSVRDPSSSKPACRARRSRRRAHATFAHRKYPSLGPMVKILGKAGTFRFE